VIAGDELRPGSYTDSRTNTKDTDGGALFKFVPTTPGSGQPISNLNQSPLSNGSVYALQVSCVDNKQQFGQGCEVGQGAWVAVTAGNARVDANNAGATGYYRPEDLHDDPGYTGEGVRFCWTNTENADAENYGEVMCGIDRAPLTADNTRTVTVNRFVEGDADFNQPDNLAFQPGTGNVYVIEDNPNGDIWACLPDGADRDIKTDGCVKMLSVVDSSAEPTGFLFSDDGRTAYVSIQHSADPADESMDVDGYGTDDVLMITGFRPVRQP
jgi:secreted PhoX family phosphatase